MENYGNFFSKESSTVRTVGKGVSASSEWVDQEKTLHLEAEIDSSTLALFCCHVEYHSLKLL